MSGRFSKLIFPIISLLVITSQLVGCGSQSNQDSLGTIPVNDTNQTQLDTSSSSSTPTTPSNGTIEPMSQVSLQDLNQDQLLLYFTKAYEMGKVLECSIQDRITSELSMVEDLVARDNQGNLPTTYKEDYNSWRLQQLFSPILSDTTAEAKPIDQTVYVIGTVNIRSTWSTEGEKLGAFNKGQAIVRVGVGIEGTEAEGWSQIKVSDGQAEDGTEQFKLVYVSNKYLSTTKPSSGQSGSSSGSKQGSGSQSQASKPSGGQQQTQQPSGGQQQTQKPEQSEPSGTYDPDKQLEDILKNTPGAATQQTDGKPYTEEEMEALGKLLNGG